MGSNSYQDALAKLRAKMKMVGIPLDPDEVVKTSEKIESLGRHKAIEILKSVDTELTKLLEDMPEWETEFETVTLAVINLFLGMLYADTEELKASEEQLMKCVKLCKKTANILPIIYALNRLGIIWSQWNQLTKAKEFLIEAEKVYNDFKEKLETSDNDLFKYPDINLAAILGTEQFKTRLSPREALERGHTTTLNCLAQVYCSLKDRRKCALYCHMTLRRLLGENKLTQDLDYIDWALNSATLSQHFMEIDCFSQARHHLAAASYILQKYENILKEKTEENGESEALTAEWENFKHRSADVARCWAKYGILLMSSSKERLLRRIESDHEDGDDDEDDDDDDDDDDEARNESESNINDLAFDILEKEIEPIANQITDKYLLDFDDARLVFLNALKWLEQAKTYYTLEHHASDHVSIVQDVSQAYKYLSFFEDNEDRQAKMHRRRIDVLENVIKELNPQYYQSACRQIWYELGETYACIIEIKVDRLRSSDEKLTPQVLAKINRLAYNGIDNFQSFLNSIQMCNSGTEFPDEVMKSALLAYIHIARLHQKINTPDKTAELENTLNSYNAFKFVIDYCDKYPKGAEVMKAKLNLAREMIDLIQVKLNVLRVYHQFNSMEINE